jgi:hypothetical protein
VCYDKFMRKFTRKQKWIGIVVLILVVLIGVVVTVVSKYNNPGNLGSQLEYVGKYNSSCDWGGYIISMGFCSPQNEYFFATNMTVEELKVYFGRASLIDYQDYSDVADKTFSGAELKYQRQGASQDFSIFYYNSSDGVINKYHLQATNKAHVVAIRSFYSDEAKASLN